jgi:hypothetical protein
VLSGGGSECKSSLTREAELIPFPPKTVTVGVVWANLARRVSLEARRGAGSFVHSKRSSRSRPADPDENTSMPWLRTVIVVPAITTALSLSAYVTS